MDALEKRIVALESLLAEQDRTMDDLSEEILRLNRLVQLLTARLDERDQAYENSAMIKSLAEEVPPPHY